MDLVFCCGLFEVGCIGKKVWNMCELIEGFFEVRDVFLEVKDVMLRVGGECVLEGVG